MPEWLSRLTLLISGGPEASTGTMLLRGALVGCSVFATVQLLTMLSTRWGERHALGKSFVLSILLHFCFGLGWATVVEQSRAHRPAPVEEDEIALPTQRVFLESDEPQPYDEPGTTPVWQRSQDVPELPVTRVERNSDPLALPEIEPSPSLEAPFELPELPRPVRPPEQAAMPELTASVDRTRPLPAATLDAEAPSIPSAPSLPSMSVRPERLERPKPNLEVPDLPPSRGDAQRIAQATLDPAALTIPLAAAEGSTIPKPLGVEAEMIQRKAAQAAAPTPDLGAGDGERATNTNTPESSASRFARTTPRMTSPADAPLPVPERSPTAPAPAEVPQETLIASRAASSALPSADRVAPEVVRSAGPAKTAARVQDPAETYKLRRLEKRLQTAVRNGGTESSEKAVELALLWLAKNQEPEGFWDSSKHGGGFQKEDPDGNNRLGSGSEADAGLTGMALLCFLGAGYTQDEGQYTEVVDKAVTWLIGQQREDGYLGGKATFYDAMYCHGIASYALAEAVGMQEDPQGRPELRAAVTRAIHYISLTQNSDGGWRYRAGTQSDMSMFGWQLMAVKSAGMAGIEAPVATQRGMFEFLRDRSRDGRGQKDRNGGLAGYYYRDNEPPRPAMTAEAWFCKQMYGLRRTSQASSEASQYLLEHLPKRSAPNYYYWYYGTLSMFQHGGKPWNEWNDALRDVLISEQRKTGPMAGTWDPVDPWGGLGGRLYSTTFCTLSLEVYYRFLPLHQQREP